MYIKLRANGRNISHHRCAKKVACCYVLVAVACKRLQQQLTTSSQQCCVLAAVVCKRMKQLPTTRNSMQQDEQADATCNTMKNIGNSFYLLASNVVSVCTLHGAFEMASNKFCAKKERHVGASSSKKNTCGLILVSDYLIFAFGVVAYGIGSSNVLVYDNRVRNEKWRPGTYKRIYNSMISED